MNAAVDLTPLASVAVTYIVFELVSVNRDVDT
jgi:hypothetical protein